MANRSQTMTPDPLERLERRRNQIDFILRRDFPGTNAPPPMSTLSKSTAAAGNRRLEHEAWQHRQDAQKARRIELSKMSDEQLAAISEQRRVEWSEQDRARRGKQTPDAVELDADFWTREDEWELHDAALLLVNLEPRTGLGLHLKEMLRGAYDTGSYVREDQTPEGLSDEARAKLGKVQEIVRRALIAHRKGKLAVEFGRRIDSETRHAAVEPRPFLLWAISKGYELPKALAAFAAVEREQKRSVSATEKATSASADARRNRNAKRDRLIHAARAAGREPKQIGADRSIVGDKKLSAARIRAILRSHKP